MIIFLTKTGWRRVSIFLMSEFLLVVNHFLWFSSLEKALSNGPEDSKTYTMKCVSSKNSDQLAQLRILISLCCPHEETSDSCHPIGCPAQMPRLILVFTRHTDDF